MLVSALFLVAGFFLLAKGGDLLVEGASSVAKHFRVPELVIGLTIVSLGTSAPELLVNVIASIGGNSEIALGNVFGSNICNTLLILGVSAFIAPIAVGKGTVWKEVPFCIFISLILGLLLNDSIYNGSHEDSLSRGDGLILIILFCLFMYYVYTISAAGDISEENETPDMGVPKALGYIAIGLIGLVGGGKFVVSGAVDIAKSFGVSEAMIGLTIVAVGTSLPELFASAVAARRGKSDIAIGNVVGSNIFNILFVLGLSSTIKPIPYPDYMNMDLMVVFLSILIVFVFLFAGKKHRLERSAASLLVLSYLFYTAYLVYRG